MCQSFCVRSPKPVDKLQGIGQDHKPLPTETTDYCILKPRSVLVFIGDDYRVSAPICLIYRRKYLQQSPKQSPQVVEYEAPLC